uniref:U3 small nucleolar RNA-associated protein 6 homolog n=1 Tax=Clastoptera arizonana TaxID=38151 RepID=A0A1B6E402_9HEMI
MAEEVELRTEEMIPELENMMLFLFDRKEIRAIIKKRKEFEYKLHCVTKDKRDCLRNIQYETSLLKLVKARRQKKGIKVAKLSKIDFSIANRINKLFILAIRWFPNEHQIWLSYIKFCKDVRFYASASRVLEQMLELHSDKEDLFRIAARWELEECLCVEKARKYLINGLHIHKESRLLFTEAFNLELVNASNKRKELKESNLPFNPADQILCGKAAEVIYENAVKKIHDVSFAVELLNIAKDYDFTEHLQNRILMDMSNNFPRDELTWDTMAKRELQGCGRQPESGKLTLKSRIRKCVSLYEQAVQTVDTERMWALYLETLLDLNRETTVLPIFKRKYLLNALQAGHDREKLSEKYYLIWVDYLQGSDKGKKLCEILRGATMKLCSSVILWQTRLRVHLTRGEENAAITIFNTATATLGPNSLPLWKLMLQYWQTKKSSKVEELFKKSMCEGPSISSPLKPMYLEWLVLTHGIFVARKAYASLCNSNPPCLEMHTKMAQLESVQTQLNLKNARRCYLMACVQFGTTNVDVWMDYVKFEQTHGDPSKVSGIYWQAVKTLEPAQVDNFISEFSLISSQP